MEYEIRKIRHLKQTKTKYISIPKKMYEMFNNPEYFLLYKRNDEFILKPICDENFLGLVKVVNMGGSPCINLPGSLEFQSDLLVIYPDDGVLVLKPFNLKKVIDDE